MIQINLNGKNVAKVNETTFFNLVSQFKDLL